jgi:hypothetical protein
MKTDTKTLAAELRRTAGYCSEEAADRLEELERELAVERALADRLRKSAQALVGRWETPFWKDVPHTGKFIRSIEDALAAWKEARNV